MRTEVVVELITGDFCVQFCEDWFYPTGGLHGKSIEKFMNSKYPFLDHKLPIEKCHHKRSLGIN